MIYQTYDPNKGFTTFSPTGAFRPPKKGEYYLYLGRLPQYASHNLSNPYIILKKLNNPNPNNSFLPNIFNRFFEKCKFKRFKDDKKIFTS
jgi:hypothetical protein